MRLRVKWFFSNHTMKATTALNVLCTKTADTSYRTTKDILLVNELLKICLEIIENYYKIFLSLLLLMQYLLQWLLLLLWLTLWLLWLMTWWLVLVASLLFIDKVPFGQFSTHVGGSEGRSKFTTAPLKNDFSLYELAQHSEPQQTVKCRL